MANSLQWTTGAWRSASGLDFAAARNSSSVRGLETAIDRVVDGAGHGGVNTIGGEANLCVVAFVAGVGMLDPSAAWSVLLASIPGVAQSSFPGGVSASISSSNLSSSAVARASSSAGE